MAKRFSAAIAFMLCAVMLSFISCSPGDDEKVLIELVEKAASLAEKHEIGEIMALATEDFRAYPGSMDRRDAKRVLFMAFNYYGELKVIHPEPDIDLEPEDGRPTVTVPFLILRKNQSLPELEGLYKNPKEWIKRVGENADLYRFKLKVIKADGEWFVKEAYLERFTGLGFNP